MGLSTKALLFMLILNGLSSSVHAKRILLLPSNHGSHVNLFATAGKALKQNGHDVYILISHKHQSTAERYGLVPLYHDPTKDSEEISSHDRAVFTKAQTGDLTTHDILGYFIPKQLDLCIDTVRNQPLMDNIKELQFDLAINEANIYSPCMYAIPYRFDIKYVSLTVYTSPWLFGVSGMPSVEPSSFVPFSNKMSFFERIMNIFTFVAFSQNYESFYADISQENIHDLYLHKTYKPFRQLMAESEIVLVNQDGMCVDYPRVSAPHFIRMGGLSVKNAESLKDDLQEFADGATNGLIIISYGSARGMNGILEEIYPMMFNVLSKCPQRIIMQYDSDSEYKHSPEKVKLVKWFPQNDLLGHPNTRLFITHGGNNGQHEALYHGVPVLSLPVGLDQQFNAIRATTRGYGLHLDFKTMSETDLRTALHELINNRTYTENSKKCSDILKSMPSAQDTLVYWVNHILRFGSKHLHSPAGDMPMYQVLSLDVFAFLFVVVILFIVSLLFMCQCMCKWLMSKRKERFE